MDAADSDPTGRYGRRRPRPGLTPSAVVTAGRRLIERDGLDALTMRAVAAELDTAATSLYRHVPDRDALLLAILEQVASGLPVEVPGRTPRSRLRRRWTEFHDYMAEHVWVLHVLVAGSLVAEKALPFADACVADFRVAGLNVPAAARAYRACWHYTLGELLDSYPLMRPVRPTQRDRAVRDLDPDELPAMAEMRDRGRPHTGRDYARTIDSLIAALLSGS